MWILIALKFKTERKREERVTLKKLLIISVVCVFGCGLVFNTAIAADKKEAYKVGAVFSVTGGASFLGDPEKKTAEMVAEQINKNGGINGIPWS